MQYRIASMAAALAVAAAALPAAAQQAAAPPASKIGYVNTERVISGSRVAQAAKKTLEADFQKREQEILAAEARLKRVAAELEKTGASLPAAERQKRTADASRLQADIVRRRNEFVDELNLRREEALRQIVDRANIIIKRIAEQENYDLISYEATYVSPRVDITDRVIKALDAAR